MKKKYRITMHKGEKEDSFTLEAQDCEQARQIAHIAHIGTGWDVCQVKRLK